MKIALIINCIQKVSWCKLLDIVIDKLKSFGNGKNVASLDWDN